MANFPFPLLVFRTLRGNIDGNMGLQCSIKFVSKLLCTEAAFNYTLLLNQVWWEKICNENSCHVLHTGDKGGGCNLQYCYGSPLLLTELSIKGF